MEHQEIQEDLEVVEEDLVELQLQVEQEIHHQLVLHKEIMVVITQ